MHAVFPAVMEELDSGKIPFGFYHSWVVAKGLAVWSGRRVMGAWLTEGMVHRLRERHLLD